MRVKRVDSEVGSFLEVELGDGEEAVVVSDVHLGLRLRNRELSKHGEFADFLSSYCSDEKVKLVVLLGDIFEFWNARVGDIVRNAYYPVKALAKVDKDVVYVAGNHDRLVASLRLESSRGRGDLYIVPDFFVLKVNGKKFLLLHGHQLDTLFLRVKSLWKVQSYIYILSESFLSLPGPLEWFFAGLATLILLLIIGALGVSTLTGEILLVLAAFFLLSPLAILSWRKLQDKIWYGIVEGIGVKLLKSRLRGKSLSHIAVSKPLRAIVNVLESVPEVGRVDGVILGHTHVPELLLENSRLLANTGSWVENGENDYCTFVRVSSRAVTLGKWEGNGVRVLGSIDFSDK
ncbi:UDP-2,3-diacylglucosamine diphosphatase [Infirmifilum lucidum]|uniref:UDP-2,3-diacylglucosamine diphosphatase n=1 Tax=Infirmifilum lucidum TaxID=2776706 RepID=A0A7L9FHH8_9CREN|nr:UDP-2,3-diacylglucosamine diphosphatase [Infirmifilum lucidum]QOJ79219.1 UDP-2,3-diacylglucosamine diphosphatase [Infirmifilum lucidum]